MTNRLTFGHFRETACRTAPIYEELLRQQAVQPWVDGETLRADLDRTHLSPAARDWIQSREPVDYRNLISFWLTAQMVAKGPKVFQPSLERCLGLEQIEIRLSVADYVQPYPVMVVEFPEDYQKRRVCPPMPESEEEGNVVLFVGHQKMGCPTLPKGTARAMGAPTCVLIGTPPPAGKAIWLSIVFEGGYQFNLAMKPTDATIEAGLVREFGEDSYFGFDSITPAEGRICASAVRVAVNAMLLMARYGCQSLGPKDPSHYQRLQHYLQLARKKQRGIPEAERNLRLVPQLYGLPQNIVLYRTKRSKPTDAANPGSGPMRRPHWRHGHVKMHAYGPERSQRKLIFIPPVMVNGHLMCDGAKIPQTVYQMRS